MLGDAAQPALDIAGGDQRGGLGEGAGLAAGGGGAATQAFVQLAAGLRQHQGAQQRGVALGDAEGDMAAAGMPDQAHRAGAQGLDKAGHIGDMAVDGEVATFLPGARPAMPHAQRQHAEARAERLHLRREAPLVAQRAMDEKDGITRARLGIGNVIAIHAQAGHPHPPGSRSAHSARV
nr:hypothetical protein [Siccirubricoccus sp. G192]